MRYLQRLPILAQALLVGRDTHRHRYRRRCGGADPLLEVVQRLVWHGSGADLLDAAEHAGAWRHVLVLFGAGIVTGWGRSS